MSSGAAFVSSGAATSVAAFKHIPSFVCGAVAAQQQKWFPKRSVIFKDVYRSVM